MKTNRKQSKQQQIVLRNINSFPPPFKSQIVRKLHLRCQASSAVSANFAYNVLAGYVGVVATAATTSIMLASAFRVTRIEAWAAQPVAGNVNTIELAWFNTSADFISPPVNICDSSQSSDHVAHIVASPPPGSLADKFHTSTQTDNMFSFAIGTGGIVDFWFEWILNDNETTYAGPTLSGATLGIIYHKLANNLTPSYLNTI
jgi:hypothetical protein